MNKSPQLIPSPKASVVTAESPNVISIDYLISKLDDLFDFCSEKTILSDPSVLTLLEDLVNSIDHAVGNQKKRCKVKELNYELNDTQLNGVATLDVGKGATVAINSIGAQVHYVNVSESSTVKIVDGYKLGVIKEVKNDGTIDITGTLSVGEAA